MRKRPLPPLRSLHGGGVQLPPGARARVFSPGRQEPVQVFRDAGAERELKQPLRAGADGRLPGFARHGRVIIESRRIDSRPATMHRVPRPRVRPQTGERSTVFFRWNPRRVPRRPRMGARSMVHVRALAAERAAVLEARVPLHLLFMPAGPDSVEITLPDGAFDATVHSPVGQITFVVDAHGPSTEVLCGGFGVTDDGGAYWDSDVADLGDRSMVFLNPLTAGVSLQREERADP